MAAIQDLQGRAGNRAVGQRLSGPSPQEGVRIHTDARAALLAHQLDARAFTVGRDVYFGSGQFDPVRPEGQALLAHELAHAMQARSEPDPARAPFLLIDQPGSPAEHNAERAAAGADEAHGLAASPQHTAAAPGAAPGVVHRQPKSQKVQAPPTRLILARRNDVAGARRVAHDLATKIRSGRLTEDDYQFWYQAGAHFQGRALAAFRQIALSAIEDRQVLREVARQAPPQVPGADEVPPLVSPRSVSTARRIGAKHGAEYRKGIVSRELSDTVEAHIGLFEGEAKTAYRAELARAIADVRKRTEVHEPGERRLLENRGRRLGEGLGPTARIEETHTEVLSTTRATPVGKPSVLTLVDEIRHQTGDSVSVEYYTDISGGGEITAKIPVVKDVVDIKVGAGAKVGRKSGKKKETAEIRSEAKRMTRIYEVQMLQRDVTRKAFRSVTDETRTIPSGVVLKESIDQSLLEAAAEQQIGYRVTSNLDRSTREYWPSFVGRRTQSAEEAVANALHAEAREQARLLSRLFGGGF